MSENKECLFYIDHNPPEYSGTWGGAIHKGACKLNSTDCNNTPKCFIKKLYEQLQAKEQECERLSALVTEAEEAPICFQCGEEPCIRQERDKYKQTLDTIKEYCKYITAFNKSNKTNKGLCIEEVLDIINEAKKKN